MKKILLILSILSFTTNMQAMLATKTSHSEDIKNLIEKLDKKDYEVKTRITRIPIKYENGEHKYKDAFLARINFKDKSRAKVYLLFPNLDLTFGEYNAPDPNIPDIKLPYISIAKWKDNDFYKLVITEEIEKLLKLYSFCQDIFEYPTRLATLKEKLVKIAKNTELYQKIEKTIKEGKEKSKKKI